MSFQRTVARKAIDWVALGSKLSSESAKGELSRLRATASEITALSNAYASPPPPIDFSAYKGKICSPGVLDMLEVMVHKG